MSNDSSVGKGGFAAVMRGGFAAAVFASFVFPGISYAQTEGGGLKDSDDFVWIESQPAAPVLENSNIPADPDLRHQTLQDYPMGDAPIAGQPLGGEPRFMDRAGTPVGPYSDQPSVSRSPSMRAHDAGGVNPDHRAYAGEQWGATIRPEKDALTPSQIMRGEQTGDDGVLEGIVDRPIPQLMRRGGETAGSASGYTHPDAIRRANTLEDRRIPPHRVYATNDPDKLPLWIQNGQDISNEVVGEWTVHEGQYLSDMLRRWSGSAGWDLVWRTQTDFMIESNFAMRATFPEAVGKVVESFRNARPAITADFFFDNKVIVVRTASDFDYR